MTLPYWNVTITGAMDVCACPFDPVRSCLWYCKLSGGEVWPGKRLFLASALSTSPHPPKILSSLSLTSDRPESD